VATLKEMFDREGTDKGAIWGYHHIYPLIFPTAFRDTVRMVLEVGIGTMIPGAASTMYGWALANYRPGGSLRVWRDYFPHAMIYGLDIQPDTQFEEDRIHTDLCDSTNADSVTRLFEDRGAVWDVMIDDGSHDPSDQLATFRNLFRYLRPGGVYAIEDCIDPTSWAVLQGEVGSRSDVESILGGNLIVIKKSE
jgi:hypothetical protein